MPKTKTATSRTRAVSSSKPSEAVMNDDELRQLFNDAATSVLTQDQRLGLLLLIDGTRTDQKRVKHALELLFPAGP